MSQSNVSRLSGETDWRRVSLFAVGFVVTIPPPVRIVGAEPASIWLQFKSALRPKKSCLLILLYRMVHAL